MAAYHCKTCGELHEELPDIGDDKPYHWYTIPEAERTTRSQLTSDTCIIDGEDYFIRGVLEIPLTDGDGYFGFGVWISQSQTSFEKYLANFDSDLIGPFFGWLCSEIKVYTPSTIELKTQAHFRIGNLRPQIIVEATDHPLAIDQHHGITLDRAWEIVHCYMQ